MNKETTSIQQPATAVIPQLKDPKHPGMFLVSKIALFSFSLFLLLFVLLAIVGNRVMLNFELDATAHFSQEQLWVTIDEKQASVIEPGEEVAIRYENGASVRATVSEISVPTRGEINMMVVVKGGELSSLPKEEAVQNISLSVEQPLKDFMLSKLTW